jgi:sterol 3beta-glucosyltransferase
MKITILTYGSAGDVLPYISLALGLMETNHEVILAAPQNFEDLIRRYGIHYSPLYGNSQALLESEQGQKWMAAGDTKTFIKELSSLVHNIRYELQRDALAACQNAQLIIAGTLMLYYAVTISEKLQIPMIIAVVNPVCVATTEFPHLLMTQKKLPFGFLNLLTYNLVFKQYHKSRSDTFNEWRRKLGITHFKGNVYDQIKKLKIPVIHGYSENLLSKPRDWEPHVSVTGVWKTDKKYAERDKPDKAFMNWINSGEPPVYFGFGSMPVLDPNAVQQMIFDICDELGIRAVINAGWSKFNGTQNEFNDKVYFIKHADLEWLFPLCSIIVHHGGVGTTHLSLEAGVPTIICSILWDNPLWGERLKHLNIGSHIRFKDLDKNKLIKAIKRLQDEKVKKNAIHMGDKVRKEKGLNNAIDFIDKYKDTAPVYNSSFK